MKRDGLQFILLQALVMWKLWKFCSAKASKEFLKGLPSSSLCCEQGWLKVAELLIAHGAKINAKDKEVIVKEGEFLIEEGAGTIALFDGETQFYKENDPKSHEGLNLNKVTARELITYAWVNTENNSKTSCILFGSLTSVGSTIMSPRIAKSKRMRGSKSHTQPLQEL